MRCVGCNKEVPTAVTAGRCACGSTVYHDEKIGGFFLPPYLMMIALFELPAMTNEHIEDIIGDSPYKSALKTSFISKLERIGYTWARDCPKCKEKRIPVQKPRAARLKKTDGTAAVEEWERMIKGGA